MNEQQPMSPETSNESSAAIDGGVLPSQLAAELPEDAGEVEPRAGPQIYVASLTDYNNGILHGTWLEAAVEPDELQAGITAMLKESPTTRRYGEPAEEWAIHDHEGFGPLRIGEYHSPEWITKAANGITEHGMAFAAWLANGHGNLEELEDSERFEEQFEEQFLGHWDSAVDYAGQLLDDFGLEEAIDRAVPEGLRSYVRIDSESFAHDLELGGDITVIDDPEGGVWVFGR